MMLTKLQTLVVKILQRNHPNAYAEYTFPPDSNHTTPSIFTLCNVVNEDLKQFNACVNDAGATAAQELFNLQMIKVLVKDDTNLINAAQSMEEVQVNQIFNYDTTLRCKLNPEAKWGEMNNLMEFIPSCDCNRLTNTGVHIQYGYVSKNIKRPKMKDFWFIDKDNIKCPICSKSAVKEGK